MQEEGGGPGCAAAQEPHRRGTSGAATELPLALAPAQSQLQELRGPQA